MLDGFAVDCWALLKGGWLVVAPETNNHLHWDSYITCEKTEFCTIINMQLFGLPSYKTRTNYLGTNRLILFPKF